MTRNPIRSALLMAAAVTALFLQGCVSSGAQPAALSVPEETYASLARYQRVYVLNPGDQIEMTVANIPEWNRTAIIRPDGMFTIPRIGDVNLRGLSVAEATDRLEAALGQRLVDPEVTIAVQNPRDEVVLVAGDVARQGPVPTRQAQTVGAAILAAGGALRSGSIRNVALIRLDEEGHMVARILKPQSSGQAGVMMSLATIPVQGGDMIFIPESGRSQFTRFVQDLINTPLSGVNQLFTPYLQFRLIESI